MLDIRVALKQDTFGDVVLLDALNVQCDFAIEFLDFDALSENAAVLIDELKRICMRVNVKDLAVRESYTQMITVVKAAGDLNLIEVATADECPRIAEIKVYRRAGDFAPENFPQ